MRYAIIALLFCGCGVNIQGLHDVKVVHEVKVDNLVPYITAYCEVANHTPEDVTACVNLEIGKFLERI